MAKSSIGEPVVTGSRKERRLKWWKEKKVEQDERVQTRAKTETPSVGGEEDTESATTLKITRSKSGFKSRFASSEVTNKKSQIKENKDHRSPRKDTKPKNKTKRLKKKQTIKEKKPVEDKPDFSQYIPKQYVLFVGNLPYDATKEMIEDHFRKTGGLIAVRLPKEKGSEKSRGFAYIELKDRISHGIALRLHHTTLNGRRINVEFTSVGGGKSQKRKEKLKKKNSHLHKFKLPLEALMGPMSPTVI